VKSGCSADNLWGEIPGRPKKREATRIAMQLRHATPLPRGCVRGCRRSLFRIEILSRNPWGITPFQTGPTKRKLPVAREPFDDEAFLSLVCQLRGMSGVRVYSDTPYKLAVSCMINATVMAAGGRCAQTAMQIDQRLRNELLFSATNLTPKSNPFLPRCDPRRLRAYRTKNHCATRMPRRVAAAPRPERR
jgi:hypothetical protein